MFKRLSSLVLAILMVLGMVPFTGLTSYAAKNEEANYFFPTLDTERIYLYIEREDMEFSAEKFSEGCWIDAWPTGQKSTYTFNYLGSYYEYKKSEEYMPSVAKVAHDIAWDYFDVEMNEIIIYRVDRGDGLAPLYGAVIAYDPMDGVCFYAVSTPDGSPVIYNFTEASGSIRIDVEYYTDHGLGTKEIYHTVTYRDDDGTYLSSQQVRSGKNAIPPSPPRKNGITGQWNHTGEFIEQDTDIFADYTGGDVFKPERPEDYYSSGQQVFLRDDYNQKVDRFLENRGMSPTAVENMVVGHTFEDIQVQYGLWDKQKMQLKELGTYGEIKSGTYFFDDFIELLEYLCETYSFNMNDIVCYDSGMSINGQTRHCVVMGYDYEYSAVAIAYGIGDIQLHLYSPNDLRDQFIDITFDIDIMSGHATRPTHTVKYVTESGSPIQTVMIQHGKNVHTFAIPEVPEKDGYAGVWSHDGAGITGDTTIYPVYTRIGDELEDNGPYAVSFYMPAWIVNLRSDEPVTDENGKVYADEDFVLVYTEMVEHGESVKNIPTIPWEASEPYEWYDWNNECTNITESQDILVVSKSGGKRVFKFNGKAEDIKCGSPYGAYGTIHKISPIDWPDLTPYIKDTEIGYWAEDKREDLVRTYGIYTADVLAQAELYTFVCTYADGVQFPKDGYYYEFTASDEHLTEKMLSNGTTLGYKGLFGNLTAQDLYKDDPEAQARFAALTEIVEKVAAEYKLNPKDIPIHGMSRDGGEPDDEYVVWVGYTCNHDGIYICEHGYHYFLDSIASGSEKYGKTLGTPCGGTVEDISKKALEYEKLEATPVELCTITFTFNGTVISTLEAPAGSKYELPEPMAIRGYRTEGWKYNGALVGKEVVLEGSSMLFDASYVEDAGANIGLENTVFGYLYYFDSMGFSMSGLTTDKGTVNIGALSGPEYQGLLKEDITGCFVLEHIGTYDDLGLVEDGRAIGNFWEDILKADQDYTPTAKNIPVYKLLLNGEFFSYGIIRAYDAQKGAFIFDGQYQDNYLISMSPLAIGTDILFNINYDGSALPYFVLDTTADNVIFANAWSVNKVSDIKTFNVSGMTAPVVDQYGTVGTVSGKWNLEKLGKYSELKNEIYTYYLDSTVQNAAKLLGVAADDVIVYEFRNGLTHVAYGTVIGQAGGNSGDTKLLFIGDTTKEGSCFCISHASEVSGYYTMTQKGNGDYSAAIKKGFEEYVLVSFYANNEKVSEVLVVSGTALTNLPAVPEKTGYTGTWDYDNSPITEETRINAIYVSDSGEELDDPINDRTFIPLGKELEDGDIIAIRSGDLLLSYVDGKKIAVEENEDGEIVAPFKKVQWKVTKNEDGTYVFTSYATGEQLAVFTDDEGNFIIGTVADSDESNPGGSELPEASESETDLEESTETEETETEVETEPEAETKTEPAAIGTDWTIESAGGHIYLKTTVSVQTLYLTLSGEDEWTAGDSGSTISFWKTTEEPVIPDEPDVPDDPEDPEEPESGRGPLSKEELDKNRPTTNPEDFMAAEALNPGDHFILYCKPDFDSHGKYRLLNNNNWGYNLTSIYEYNAETGAIKSEDIPETCIWTLELDSASCPLCDKPLYFLKNVNSGQYIVYTGSRSLLLTSNLEDSSIAIKSVHLEYREEKTEDTVTRTIANFYYHYKDDVAYRELYITVSSPNEQLVGILYGGQDAFYVSRPGENKEYYSVQYLVDGEVYDVKYAFEGTEIEHPELPRKEGYSYCWAVEGDTVTVNEDLIFESISSKDVTTLYMTYLLYHDNKYGVGEYNMNLYWDTDLFHKDAIKDFYLRKTSGIATFFNGYNETSISGNNQALVIGEFGYLRDYTNESHKQMIENKYKSKIIDVYGEEAFNNLMLHTISMNGEIIGIGFFGGYFICDDNSEDKDYSARYQVYNFETVVGEQNPTVYLSKDVVHYYYRYPKGFCGWDLNCGYDDLFSFENFESHTVVFKDLDGNVIYQEEVPYYGKVQIIPDVPQKEGYEGAWFATQALYTGIFEDKVIYPIYYEVMAEHGTLAGISNDGPNRAFFDNDYSTALYEDFFGGFSHNGIMSASSNYSSVLDYKEYGNTITLGYIGLVSELAIYTENNNGFINIDQYKKENYRSNFNSKHYSNYSKDHTAEDEIELPVFALIDEETGELFEIVIGYAAFAMSNEKDVAEYPVVGIFDPQLYGSACIYTTRPADKPVSLYSPYAMSYLRPLWHFSEGTESFSLDVFSGLKNIEVTYVDENGEGIYTEVLAIGGSVENVPAVPAKEGYTGAWDHTGTGIVGKTVISPVYTQITYTVTIHLGEGKSYELEVAYGEDVGLPATPPVREGYIGSWDHDGKNITEDTVINAVYEKQPFTVTFIIDGVTVSTQTIATGESASLPGIPEKSGYNGVWDHDGKNITADTVITAVYTKKTYEVKFVANGKTVNTQDIEHGKDAILPAVPEKEGHTGEWNGDYTNVTSDRTVRAVYTAKKYNVRYYDEDGNLVSKQTVAFGQDTDEPDVPESKNNPGAGGRWDHDGKNITGNTYIYPDYTYETHRVRYYVDGKLYNTQYVNNTQDAVQPAVPAKEGYNGKWDKDGKNITKDTKINAVYTQKTYRVIFLVDGEEIADVGVKYGEAVTKIPAIPEKEGFSARWDKPINRVTSNMEVNAVYTVRVYQVKFYVNGEFHSYQNVEHGRNVTLPNVAPLEGLTPVWDHDGNNVREDLAIHCIYKINGYTVDKVAGTTGEVIPNGISYGYTYGNAIGTGKNEKLDLTKLNSSNEAYDLVFWSEATGEAGSFTLSVPEQVEAPVVEIDYVTGTTKDIIGTDVYYGTNENAMTASGTNEKLTVIPGTTYYFYRPADGEKLPSDTTVVNVGIVPEAIEVTIDYVGGTTNEIIGSEVEFAVSDTELSIEEAKALEFSGRGCGEKLSPEKRENAYYMYFRIAATDENFAGDITKVYVGPKGKDPNPEIDYTNVRTKNTIGSDIIYGLSADSMTKTGTGSKISLTPGQDLYLQRKGSNEKQTFASDVLHLVVPERPVITRYGVRNETIKGKGDGRLYSLTKNVKYRWQKVGSSSYYTNTFTADYISIKPGEWKLRIQATDTSFASEYVYFTVEEGRTLSLTIRESKGGEILNVIEGLSYRKAIPVPEDPTREGYVFDGWYWDNNGTERTFDFSLGISTDRTVYAKWIEVEEEVPVNELTGDKWIADFGTVTDGSGDIPAAIDVTVTNNGKNHINILVPEAQYYSVSGPETIAAGTSAVYTIAPLATLFEAGSYNEEILICNADNFDSYYFINALYTIEADDSFEITIKEDGNEVDEGGIVAEVGGEIELEAKISETEAPAPVLYSFRSRPVMVPAPAIPAGYSVSWEDIDGNVIGNSVKCKFGPFTEEGYYHYLLVVTGPKGNSAKVPITVYAGERENDHRITISPKFHKFGTNRNEVAEFIISNENGTEAVELTNIGSLKEFKGAGESNFIFGGDLFERKAAEGKVILQPGESISFTVQPKEGLEPGIYAEMVGAGVGDGTNYALAAVGYTEPEKLSVTTQKDVGAFFGSNVKLSASVTGGSGQYTYEWVNTDTGRVVSRRSSALFGTSATSMEGIINLKLTVTDEAGNQVAEQVTVSIVERPYVPSEPEEPDPVEPDPVEPDPVEPDPVEPDPVEPDPVEPDPVEPDPVEPDPVETEPVETDPVETEPAETEPSDPKDPSNTQKSKVGVIVTVGVLALSAASVIAAVVLPKKRNRKNKR